MQYLQHEHDYMLWNSLPMPGELPFDRVLVVATDNDAPFSLTRVLLLFDACAQSTASSKHSAIVLTKIYI